MPSIPPTSATLLLFSLLACTGDDATAAPPQPQQPPHAENAQATLNISFGQPTHMQRLYYRRMYDKKPYADAIIFYYDNGLYKIISPGEEHYGSYVIDGDFDAARYTIHFIALPSADWNNTSAYHVLQFDRNEGKGRFLQRAIVPIDGRIPQQYGDYAMARNPLRDPLPVGWEEGSRLMAAPAQQDEPGTH